jgi:uncharacterized membrane protein YfcA
MKAFWNNAGNYSKGIVVVSGSVLTALYPYYGHDTWYIGLIAGVTAINGILIPNQKRNAL